MIKPRFGFTNETYRTQHFTSVRPGSVPVPQTIMIIHTNDNKKKKKNLIKSLALAKLNQKSSSQFQWK